MSDIEKRKFSLSLVIPFTSDLQGREKIVQSYLDSESVNKIRIQFVFLANSKNPPFGLELTNITSHETHEIVFIGNDRFFSTGEENIYRMRDFLDILSPWVLIIGETDEVYWGNLLSALEIAQNYHLDAMLLNVEDRQSKKGGGYSSQFCALKLNDPVLQNSIVEHLINGQIIGTDIAYTSILSMYGPIDWLGYIGSHIFSRTALQGILKYRFIDPIYSFVYMQLLYFTEKPRNYMLFMNPVVVRISKDYVDDQSSERGWISLQQHRVVSGHSRVFESVHYYHLLQIDRDDIFSVVFSSLGLANVPAGNDEIGLKRTSFLQSLFLWSIQLISDKSSGNSYYFPIHKGLNRVDQDILAFSGLLRRVLRISDQTNEYVGQVFIEKIREASALLDSYFAIDCQSPMILQRVTVVLSDLLNNLSEEMIRKFHLTAFVQWASKL